MWMYLANRVFMSGASAHKGLPDTEDQGVLPLVVLPPRPTHNTDDDVDDDVAETIHLVNPSMNELMVAINNANQKPIIVTPPKNQIKNLNLQRAGRGFRAIGNEDSHPDSLTFMRMVGGGDRANYYPHFVREICTNVPAPDRALSFDDLHFVGGGDNDEDDNEDNDGEGSASMEGDSGSSSSTEAMLWRAHSEGALITMPGNRNLAQQMAILKQPHPRKKHKEDLNLMRTGTSLGVVPHNAWSPGYWITLAHILAVIACHRWNL